MPTEIINTFVFAISGGLIPAIVWLWFWLQEDYKHPEPKLLVVTTFLGGMLFVPLGIIAEMFTARILGVDIADAATYGLGMIIMASLIEEAGKFFAANTISLHKRACDEPLDIMVYMISAALGFAALENALFFLNFIDQGAESGFLVQFLNLRFMGATLLHVVASGMMGGIMALAFYRSDGVRALYTAVGLITAVVLHAIFNYFIISAGANGSPLPIFLGLWIVTIALIVLFEKVKTIRK